MIRDTYQSKEIRKEVIVNFLTFVILLIESEFYNILDMSSIFLQHSVWYKKIKLDRFRITALEGQVATT